MAFDLEGFYREHHRLVRWIVRTSGVPEASVDDVVHDVFVAAFRRRSSAPSGDRRGWLVGVAKSVSFNHRRSHSRRRVRDAAWWAAAAPESQNPERAVGERLDLERVSSVLRAMDEAQRDAFVLVELAGESPAEVAQMLGVNANTLSSRLRLARRKLRAVPCATVRDAREQGDVSPARVRAVWIAIAADAGARAVSLGGLWAAGGVAVAASLTLGLTLGGLLTRPSARSNAPLVAITPALADLPRDLPIPGASMTSVGGSEAPPMPGKRTLHNAPAATLAQESAILLRATQALDARDFTEAAAALREHAERYPRGVLRGEREELSSLAAAQHP